MTAILPVYRSFFCIYGGFMKELIKINTDGAKQTVNAEELHTFLEVKSRFNDWIKNKIKQYGFVHGVDFVVVTKKLVTEKTEYHLTINMGKELSMLQNNDKGKQARKYFIQCEKKLQTQNQLTPLEQIHNALLLSNQLIEEQKAQIEVLTPKAEFTDRVHTSDTCHSMAQAAKMLQLKKGSVTLFKALRDKGILRANNEPYQKYAHHFRLILREYTNSKGEVITKTTTKVKPSGIDYIRKQLNK